MSEATSDLKGFVDVAAIGELSPDEGRIVEADGTWLALFLADGTPHAIANACPHMAGPLGSGRCLDGIVTCPIHEWRFDVRTGQAPTNAFTRVATYETRVVDGRVFVRMSDPEAGAANL